MLELYFVAVKIASNPLTLVLVVAMGVMVVVGLLYVIRPN